MNYELLINNRAKLDLLDNIDWYEEKKNWIRW
jgi:hypothetical protein